MESQIREIIIQTKEQTNKLKRFIKDMEEWEETLGTIAAILDGGAFIPMLVGLGCNVPGIMATRTLENPRDRILSVMINPLISCEVCPQHLLLHAPDIYDKIGTYALMNPPIREKHHSEGLWKGLWRRNFLKREKAEGNTIR